jgi:hypothetical protein
MDSAEPRGAQDDTRRGCVFAAAADREAGEVARAADVQPVLSGPSLDLSAVSNPFQQGREALCAPLPLGFLAANWQQIVARRNGGGISTEQAPAACGVALP